MKVRNKIRVARAIGKRAALAAAASLFGTLLVGQSSAQTQTQPPAPIERRPPSSARVQASPDRSATAPLSPAQRQQRSHEANGEHLADWMNLHRNLTADQQRQALEREPGFQQLPQNQQQRMRDRLSQLDAMTPEERRRLLARNEAVERMTPDQRTQFRAAMSQLGSLPLEDRRTVARTFRSLRELPADERIPALNAGRFGPPMNDAQRAALYNLLRIEPTLEPVLPRSQQGQR